MASRLVSGVRLAVLVAGIAGAAGGKVAAEGFHNPNPGGAVVTTNSADESIVFAPAAIVSVSNIQYLTELVGFAHGAPVFDQTFDGQLGSASVILGLSQVAMALNAVAPGDPVTGPTFASSFSSVQDTTSTLYSHDPSAFSVVTTTLITFGPATIEATALIPSTVFNPFEGLYSHCDLMALPSAVKPTCGAVDGGDFVILNGQTDINIDDQIIYQVDTTITTNETTTITSIYHLVAEHVAAAGVPEPSVWTMMLLGSGAAGAALRRRRGRLVAEAPQGT